MADNLLLPISLEQITGSDGEVFVSAVYVYDADTDDLKNVYTDKELSTAAANPIIADGDGVLPARYIGTGSYKLVIKNTVGYPTEDLSAHWTTFKTIDNLPGALDTSTFASDQATPITPVVSKTSDFAVLTSQQGTVFDSDPTGGNITATLPSAVTAGDNFRITFKHTGTANSVIIATVSSQTIDGSATYTLEDQYEGVTLVSDGANWLISESSRLTPEVVYPPGHLYGLTLSNAADTTNDITAAAGSCRDSTNTVNIDIANALTKQIDASWVAGTNAGGRSSAGLADGTWHVFAIAKALGASADILFHNTTTPGPSDDNVLPTDYLYYRRIGSVLRESSAIALFSQYGDYFQRTSMASNVNASNGTNPGISAVTRTLSVPNNITVEADVLFGIDSGGVATSACHGLLTALSATDETPSTTRSQLSTQAAAAGGVSRSWSPVRVHTDTSKQIRSRLSFSDGNIVLYVYTLGWIDTRGKDV